MKKLFATWAEWSVFPTTYLLGLQATFQFNEVECSALTEYVVRKQEEEELDGVSIVTTTGEGEGQQQHQG